MFRSRKRLTPFKVFVIAFILYFGGHVVYGYFYCEYSEYANCPGYIDNWSIGKEEKESDD
jgi:hypothetical protein